MRRRLRLPTRFLAGLIFAVMLSACGGLPKKIEKPESHALSDTAATPLGQAVAPALAAHPGESGFYPLSQGKEAFAARIAMARAATRSLDVQYYIFHADDTGLALISELLAAADRGVRVRLLLDDIHLAGHDEALAAIDGHPQIEVRVFNPFAHRSARVLDFVTDYARVNRRMHNKSMTADNQLTVVGGRNVGDEYFAAHSAVDFSDLDLLATGPVVTKVSAVFDEYWASAVVYPLAALTKPSSEARLDEVRTKAGQLLESMKDTPYVKSLLETGLAQQLARGKIESYWGVASVIADRPEKVSLPPDDSSTHALAALTDYLEQAKTELLLVSPYFVPRTEGVKWLGSLVRKGVKVRVLTNSFAATDVGAVHAGYTPYRKALLEAGVEIYELKPGATGLPDNKRKSLTGSNRASLHAKTYMVDRSQLFVGSLNLDPRSVKLNTEMGIVMESAALCAKFGGEFDRRILDVAWHVTLEPNGKLAWTTHENGELTRLDDEPGMSTLQGVGQFFLRILPVEEQL